MTSALVSALGLIGKGSRADEPTPLDANDPTAKAFAFVTDASRVDASANPTYMAGQRCAGCTQYQGKPTAATAGCTTSP